MARGFLGFTLLVSASLPCLAQLTPYQKISDFQEIAAVYNRRYSWLDWKKAAFQFDALQLAPWLDRASKTKTDLEFFEVVVEYTASLQDSHSGFWVDSSFAAYLGFRVDF